MRDLVNAPHKLILSSVPFEVTEDLSNFTAVTLKSCSLNPVVGPCLFEEVAPDTFMNRWGLDNPGVGFVVQHILPRVIGYQKNVILSAFFSDIKEVEPFMDCLPLRELAGVEVNVTCPNKSGLSAYVSLLKEVTVHAKGLVPVGVKANLAFPTEVLREVPIDFLTYSNTIPYQHERFGSGGLSGNPLRLEVLRSLGRIRSEFKGILIAGGGVKSAQDYTNYIDLGADLVAIGSQYLKNKDIVFDILSEI